MAIIPIKFAKLHDTVFIGGTNMGDTLDTSDRRRPGLKMYLDEEKNRLSVSYNGSEHGVPGTNIRNWEPAVKGVFTFNVCDDIETKPKDIQVVPGPNKRIKAQVSDPTRDAVFGRGN